MKTKKTAETTFDAVRQILAETPTAFPTEIKKTLKDEYGIEAATPTIAAYKTNIRAGKTSTGKPLPAMNGKSPERVGAVDEGPPPNIPVVERAAVDEGPPPNIPVAADPVSDLTVRLDTLQRVKTFAQAKYGGPQKLLEAWEEIRLLANDVGGDYNLKQLLNILG